jgi:hypothetical protein
MLTVKKFIVKDWKGKKNMKNHTFDMWPQINLKLIKVDDIVHFSDGTKFMCTSRYIDKVSYNKYEYDFIQCFFKRILKSGAIGKQQVLRTSRCNYVFNDKE